MSEPTSPAARSAADAAPAALSGSEHGASLPAAWRWQMVPRASSALGFRLACYAAMIWMSLWAEARPAPSLPDAVLSHVPYVEWVDRYNFLLWSLAYLPLLGVLLARDPERFVRYNVSTGLLSLLRGLCVMATGLGPVRGADVNAGLSAETRSRALWEVLSPFGVFARDSPHLYLTKDLFFSGHASTTLLLALYLWRDRQLRWPALVGHVLVVASVFLSHLHYTIDVVGAYAIAFSLFVLREGEVRRIVQ